MTKTFKFLYWISQVLWLIVTIPIAALIYVFSMSMFAIIFVLNKIIKITNHKSKQNAKAQFISKSFEGLR